MDIVLMPKWSDQERRRVNLLKSSVMCVVHTFYSRYNATNDWNRRAIRHLLRLACNAAQYRDTLQGWLWGPQISQNMSIGKGDVKFTQEQGMKA